MAVAITLHITLMAFDTNSVDDVRRAVLDAALRENARLREAVASALRDNAQLRERITALEERLEVSQRAGKRQAAPFSKGAPKENPHTPGRKRGAHHGTHAHRDTPANVDEIVPVELPPECPRCGGEVARHGTAEQFQIELPVVVPLTTRFDIPLGRCIGCKCAIRGRHPNQVSDALGAAGVHFGPRLLAYAAMLHDEHGLSYQRVAKVLREMTGAHVSAGALTRALRRMGNKAIPTYDALCEEVAKDPVVTADETGWRVMARSAWLWIFTTPSTTIYAIEDSRGVDVARSVLGAEYDGILVRDGWAPYRQLTNAKHQTCVAHLLRRCHEMLEVAQAGARRVPLAVKRLLLDALAIRDQRDRGSLDDAAVAKALKDLERRADILVTVGNVTVPANKKLLKHLRTERPALFTFLEHPGTPATNWRAEQGLRPAVVNRKVWGGNREWSGARSQEVLMSVLRTARQRALDPAAALITLMRSPVPVVLPLRT